MMGTLMVCLVIITYHGSYRNGKVGQHSHLTKLNDGVKLCSLYMSPFSFSFVTLNFPNSS